MKTGQCNNINYFNWGSRIQTNIRSLSARYQKLGYSQLNSLVVTLHFCTISSKYFCSCSRSVWNFSTVSMSTLCFVLGFGGSNGHVRMAILASSILFGICGWLISLSTTIPYISSVSSSFPPTLPSTLIKSKLTSFLSKSATARTALTAISASARLQRWTL